jgi:hypothetical protein
MGQNQDRSQPKAPTNVDCTIPKRIIQTAKSSVLPLKERAAVCNLRLLNPEFEYLFFDDQQVEDFIDQRFPQYRSVFDSFPFRIQKYDFFRYLAVYEYGGFYFDLDVFLASDVSSLLGASSVFPCEGLTFSRYLRDRFALDWQLGNYAFGAAGKHPFLQATIENCVRAQRDPGWVRPMMKGVPPLSHAEFYVLNTTGPGLLSRTLAENKDCATGMTVLFPDDVCDPRQWNRFGEYGVHLMDGSWRLRTSYLQRRLAQRWEVWQMRKLMKESTRFGPRRALIPTTSVA